MNCSSCLAEIAIDSRYCRNCGAPTASSASALDNPTITLPRRVGDDLGRGTVLAGKFCIQQVVGRGGMGVVYLAEDLKLHRRVALKFLPIETAADPESRERFLLEARAAAALSHPGICTIYEIHDQEERPFLEMEFVEGQSLRQLVRERALAPTEAVEIAIQVARALEEAHRRGVVHRDIKSANIMVTGPESGHPGQAKVMDFGLAKVRGETLHTKEGTTLGTAAYMSPEQALGQIVDSRADLWALGVVLYEMLSRCLPFTGEREAAVLYAVAHLEPKPLPEAAPGTPPELCAIVDRALQKDLHARYGSAAEMGRDLSAYLDRAQTERLGLLTPQALWRKLRRPRVAVLAALGLIVICVASTWFFRRQGRIRWARREALPEIERMIAANDVWRNLSGAYDLAVKAEAFIPHDAKLAELFSKCSVNMSINTEPAGAEVYAKEYKPGEDRWRYLGVTPIDKIRMPIGIFRWRLEKEGYEPVLAAASTWSAVGLTANEVTSPLALGRRLDRQGSLPEGMVRVPETQTAAGKLPDFLIDQYEVTNKKYKEFINAGGYRNAAYWKYKIVNGSRDLAWKDAMTLFVDQTGRPGPATWQAADFPEGQGDYPVSGISWYEAAAYAEWTGKSLPTQYHWNAARGAYTTLIQVPQLGGLGTFAPFSNFTRSSSVPVGSLDGITAYGAFDMPGNVREWCWNEAPKGRLIRGGAWGDNTYMFEALSQAPPMDRSVKNGFRCARYLDSTKVPAAAFAMTTLQGLGAMPDVRTMKPAPDSMFHVFRERYAYDRTELNGHVDARQESTGSWVQEKVSFNAAYGSERVSAYLFLPKNAQAPYQTVIYFPGAASMTERSSHDIENYYEFPMFLSFLVKSGRAVMYPVYKGTFERGNDATDAIQSGDPNAFQFAELQIQQVKDLERCVDYLETRREIDSRKLAYYGMSWGAQLGAVIPAIEKRFQTSILLGGATNGLGRPEIKDINFVTRVKTPTLMLNGKYDTLNPLEANIRPMFDLLGTPAEHKAMKLYETDHIPPRNEYVKEALAWLDRYLGAPK